MQIKQLVGEHRDGRRMKDLADAASTARRIDRNSWQRRAGSTFERWRSKISRIVATDQGASQRMERGATRSWTDLGRAEAEDARRTEGAQRLQDWPRPPKQLVFGREACAGTCWRPRASRGLGRRKAALRAVEAESEALASINEKRPISALTWQWRRKRRWPAGRAPERLADAAEAAGTVATLIKRRRGVRQKIG